MIDELRKTIADGMEALGNERGAAILRSVNRWGADSDSEVPQEDFDALGRILADLRKALEKAVRLTNADRMREAVEIALQDSEEAQEALVNR